MVPNSEYSSVIRRLAAILIADVVGYTRLMERDDTGTFARLRSIRDEVVDPSIVSHGGRIVKTAGDGLVAEFASALSALWAAVHVQRQPAACRRGSRQDPARRSGIHHRSAQGEAILDASGLHTPRRGALVFRPAQSRYPGEVGNREAPKQHAQLRIYRFPQARRDRRRR